MRYEVLTAASMQITSFIPSETSVHIYQTTRGPVLCYNFLHSPLSNPQISQVKFFAVLFVVGEKD